MNEGITELLKDTAIPTEERAPQQFTEAEIISETKNEPVKESDATEEPVKMSAEMVEAGADLTIGLFDVAQTSIFRFLVKKRKNKKLIALYGDKALDKLEYLLDEQEAKSSNKLHVTEMRSFSPEEMGMLRIAKAVEEITEDLPMSESEKDLIKIPLMEIMKKRGGTLPPEYALMLGILQIAGARTGEILMI
jgi:hypothetical protein